MNPPSRCSVVGERQVLSALSSTTGKLDSRVFFIIFQDRGDKHETSVTTCYSGKQKGYICQQLYMYIIISEVTHSIWIVMLGRSSTILQHHPY